MSVSLTSGAQDYSSRTNSDCAIEGFDSKYNLTTDPMAGWIGSMSGIRRRFAVHEH